MPPCNGKIVSSLKINKIKNINNPKITKNHTQNDMFSIIHNFR